MKQIRSILALLMAFLILGLSAGFSVSQHFCQGKLWESSLLGDAAGCGMEAREHSAQPHGAASFSKEPCCEQHVLALNIKDATNLLKVKNPGHFAPVKFLAAFSSIFLYSLPSPGQGRSWYSGYSPPRIGRDIPLLFQVFLI
ncbi:MAG TPA: hypothetical protein VD772_06975 [Anseongella sp.]|nr:hypothetical protein [Anseongella sp.]